MRDSEYRPSIAPEIGDVAAIRERYCCAMHSIDFRLCELAQLYDSLDPSPFREKSLDGDALPVEFMVH